MDEIGAIPSSHRMKLESESRNVRSLWRQFGDVRISEVNPKPSHWVRIFFLIIRSPLGAICIGSLKYWRVKKTNKQKTIKRIVLATLEF